MRTIDEIISGSKPRPVVIAHRGASHYYHENTMEAFEAAVDMSAEMIEFDVRRTFDGVLVVHHDSDFAGSEINRPQRLIGQVLHTTIAVFPANPTVEVAW